MTDISPVSSRLQAIQARVAQIEQASGAAGDSARLGFGLALQNAAIDAAQASSGPQVPSASVPAGPLASAPAVSTTTALANPSTAAPAPSSAGSNPAASSPNSSSPSSGSGQAAPVESTPPVSSPAGGASAGSTPAEVRPDLTPATVRSGSYGPLTPPAELVPYGNGRVPSAALAPVGDTGHLLYGPAATALNTLIADASDAGITVGITDSYRSFAAQQDLADRKGLYSRGGLAARPGTSNHGWGVATDLRLDGEALAWMRDNGWRYGFVEDVPREPWHWTYRPDQP